MQDKLSLKICNVIDTHTQLGKQAIQLTTTISVSISYTTKVDNNTYKAEFTTNIQQNTWDNLEPHAKVKLIICCAWQDFKDSADTFKPSLQLDADAWQALTERGRMDIDFKIKSPKKALKSFRHGAQIKGAK